MTTKKILLAGCLFVIVAAMAASSPGEAVAQSGSLCGYFKNEGIYYLALHLDPATHGQVPFYRTGYTTGDIQQKFGVTVGSQPVWVLVSGISFYGGKYPTVVFTSLRQVAGCNGDSPVQSSNSNGAQAPLTKLNCSCLEYFQAAWGLPGTGYANYPAYTYGDDWLPKNGFAVTYDTPSIKGLGPFLLVGDAIVFSPTSRVVDPTSGHIGIVTSAGYDANTKTWTFIFKDTNSSFTHMGGPSVEHGCPGVTTSKFVTTDLTGIRFFRFRKP